MLMPRSIALRKHMQGRRGYLSGGVNLYISQAAYDAYMADTRPTAADKALAGGAVKGAADLTALGFTDSGGVNLSYTAKDGTLALKTSGTVPVVAFDRGATTNGWAWSEDLSNAAWVKSGTTASGSTITEDSSVGAVHRIKQTPSYGAGVTFTVALRAARAVGSRHLFIQAVGSGGSDYCGQFINLATGQLGAVQSAGTGSVVSASATQIDAATFDVAVTIKISAVALSELRIAMASATTVGSDSYSGDGTSALTLTKMRVSPGAGVPSYLATTATAPLYTAGTPRLQNLIANATDPTGASWTRGTNVNLAATGVSDPIGGSGAIRVDWSGAATGANLYRTSGTITTVSGCAYVVGAWIRAVSGSGTVQIADATGVISGVATQPVTTAWAWCRLYGVASGINAGLVTIQKTAGSPAQIEIYLPHVYEGTADLPLGNVPQTTGTAYSEYPQLEIVHELGATNYSKQQAASWTKRGTATVTDASDAQMGAYLQVRGLTGVGVNDTYQSISGLSASANYEPALWARRVSTTGVFNLAEPNASNGAWAIDCSKLPPYWVRITRDHPAVTISTEFTSTAGGLCGLHLYRNSGATAIDIDICHQLEAGRVSTAHIPTTSASVTRTATADAATMTTSSSAGMWIAEFVVNNAASATKQIIMKRGAAELYVQSGSVKVTDGTNTVTAGTAVTGVTNRVSVSWTGASLKASLNGAAVVSGSFTGTFGSGGTVYLGNDGAGASLQSGGLRKVANAPSAAANDTILQSAAAGGV